jgi:multimeric flavodoxin WrbA
MKIAAIIGSPHGMEGNTGQLLHALLDAATEHGANVTTISLGQHDVAPCRACDTCHKTGDCAIRDDFDTIKRAMLDADGIVLASPNYISNVTAQMKALLDRCCGPLHLQACVGKYGAAVVSSGGEGSKEIEDYLLRCLRALGCRTVGSVGTEARKLADDAARTHVLQEAALLGTHLADAIQNRKAFPEQDAERGAFSELMRQLVESRKDEWTFEYEAWRCVTRDA